LPSGGRFRGGMLEKKNFSRRKRSDYSYSNAILKEEKGLPSINFEKQGGRGVAERGGRLLINRHAHRLVKKKGRGKKNRVERGFGGSKGKKRVSPGHPEGKKPEYELRETKETYLVRV